MSHIGVFHEKSIATYVYIFHVGDLPLFAMNSLPNYIHTTA